MPTNIMGTVRGTIKESLAKRRKAQAQMDSDLEPDTTNTRTLPGTRKRKPRAKRTTPRYGAENGDY